MSIPLLNVDDFIAKLNQEQVLKLLKELVECVRDADQKISGYKDPKSAHFNPRSQRWENEDGTWAPTWSQHNGCVRTALHHKLQVTIEEMLE